MTATHYTEDPTQEGLLAFFSMLQERHNPYPVNTCTHRLWKSSFRQARNLYCAKCKIEEKG